MYDPSGIIKPTTLDWLREIGALHTVIDTADGPAYIELPSPDVLDSRRSLLGRRLKMLDGLCRVDAGSRSSGVINDFLAADVLNATFDPPDARRRISVRKVGLFDADQLSDIVPGSQIEHRLLEPSTFNATAVHFDAVKFRLDYLRYSAPVAIKGAWPGTGIALAFALQMPGKMVAFGAPQPPFSMLYFDPTNGIDLRLPARGEWIVLSIDRDEFELALLRLGGYVASARLPEGVALRVPSPCRGKLATVLWALVDEATRAHLIPPDQFLRPVFCGLLFYRFLDAFVAARPIESNGHGALARRRRLVMRTEEYVIAHIDESIRLKKLCRDVGASARTLEYAFKGVYGKGVMDSLRTFRLNEVRKKLLRSGHDVSTTVTSAAMDWGFWHLGEFSAAYKRLFGELPSQTLRPQPRHLA
jgi:AraC family ethanolamine operon transcriptional activator